jgi:hypothetical protein
MDSKNPEPPAIFSFAEHVAGMRQFAGPLQELSEAWKRQQEQIAEALRAIGRDFEKSYPQMRVACDRLADLGWTIPMEVTPRTFVGLADPLHTDADIEQMLSDFYTDNDFEQLRVVQRDLVRSQALARYHSLIGEAFEAYYQGLHQIPVPALLAIIEGLVAAETGNLNSRAVALRKLAAEREAQAPSNGLEALMWRSARRLIDNVFADSDFSGPQPSRINRHWVLHGRDAGPWTKADAVRFFVAIHTMA